MWTSQRRRPSGKRRLPQGQQDRNREEGLGYRIINSRVEDFYNSYDKDAVTEMDRERFETFLKGLEDWEKKVLETEQFFYVIELENHGLVMPVPLQMTFEDGTTEDVQIPAEIWAKDARNVSRLFMTQSRWFGWRLIAFRGWRMRSATTISTPRTAPIRFKLFRKSTANAIEAA